MTGPVVEIHGASQLRAALRRGGDDLSDLKQANQDAANIALRAATLATPRRTGLLESSLRASGTKTQGIIRAGRSSVPYAGVVHWGWPRRHIHAQPWIVDAAHDTEPAWTGVYIAAINRIINRIEETSQP